jgi:hypothetical protein
MFFSCWLDLLAELGLPTAQNQQHNIDRGNSVKHRDGGVNEPTNWSALLPRYITVYY